MSDYSRQIDAENERRLNEILDHLPQFAKLYFDDARRSKLPRTRLGYARDLQHFFDWLQDTAGFRSTNLRTASPAILEQLTFEDFEEYKSSIEYSSRTDAHGRPFLTENSTLARRLSALRSFMAFYYRIGAIHSNPAMYISMPKIPDHEIIALDPSDVDMIMQTAYDRTGLTNTQITRRQITAKRDIAILTTLLGTGIRVSELVGLDMQSVDFRHGMLTVTLKGGNDGHSYFGSEVESALRDYIENGRPLLKPAVTDSALFLSVRHQRITVRSVELLVKDYVTRAGIANADRITPHKLRATYGTHLYEQSGDIKLVAATLHHKSIETTSKHYVRDSEDLHEQIVRYTDQIFDKHEKTR